jgi:hypothetical protein
LDTLAALKPKALYYSHFGPATNPVRKLQDYANQLELWARIAAEGTKRGHSVEEIRERIINADATIQKAAQLMRVHPILSETVLNNSVQGFVDHAEKMRGEED